MGGSVSFSCRSSSPQEQLGSEMPAKAKELVEEARIKNSRQAINTTAVERANVTPPSGFNSCNYM
jgi:hypothetical protein